MGALATYGLPVGTSIKFARIGDGISGYTKLNPMPHQSRRHGVLSDPALKEGSDIVDHWAGRAAIHGMSEQDQLMLSWVDDMAWTVQNRLREVPNGGKAGSWAPGGHHPTEALGKPLPYPITDTLVTCL